MARNVFWLLQGEVMMEIFQLHEKDNGPITLLLFV